MAGDAELAVELSVDDDLVGGDDHLVVDADSFGAPVDEDESGELPAVVHGDREVVHDVSAAVLGQVANHVGEGRLGRADFVEDQLQLGPRVPCSRSGSRRWPICCLTSSS